MPDERGKLTEEEARAAGLLDNEEEARCTAALAQSLKDAVEAMDEARRQGWREQAGAVEAIRAVAQKYNVPVLTATQPRPLGKSGDLPSPDIVVLDHYHCLEAQAPLTEQHARDALTRLHCYWEQEQIGLEDKGDWFTEILRDLNLLRNCRKEGVMPGDWSFHDSGAEEMILWAEAAVQAHIAECRLVELEEAMERASAIIRRRRDDWERSHS